jgi:DNA-directed RNA polymerase subunit RPC12/RpoP
MTQCIVCKKNFEITDGKKHSMCKKCWTNWLIYWRHIEINVEEEGYGDR